ncbi:hypothetical protein RJ639_030087 [Escallonia herrerae]|uniref:Cytochrome P450 n=1 Tax=Escallonia herrerae TaxID=1293975 RepID=A0AA88X117_9ASTE|nr:hypothetical protein RJ639_030087 [Escallonia herrerae]
MGIDDPDHMRLSNPFAVLKAGLMSFPINIPDTTMNRSIKAGKIICEELIAIIKQRKHELFTKTIGSSVNRDLLSCMLLATDEDGKFMTDMEICNQILGSLIASHHTTSTVISFIVKYLAELPDIYREVYRDQFKKQKGVREPEPEPGRVKAALVITAVVIVAQIILNLLRRVIGNLVLNVIQALPYSESTQHSCNRTRSQSRPHPSKLALLLLLLVHLPVTRLSISTRPITLLPISSLPITRLPITRLPILRCSIRIPGRRARLISTLWRTIRATVGRRRSSVVPRRRRWNPVGRRVIRVRRTIARIAHGHLDLDFTMRTARGTLELQLLRKGLAHANIIEDLTELEPSRADQRLGVLAAGLGVDDVDVEGRVLYRGV